MNAFGSMPGLFRGDYLEWAGLDKIDKTNCVPQKGDVAVIQPHTKGESGHMQMWNSKQWESDYPQKLGEFYPNDTYRKVKPSYKSIARLLCAVLLALCLPSPALSSRMMEDPFVGLQFDPSATRYEEVPRAEYEKMDLRDGPWWVFAKYKRSDGGVYLVVSGLVRNEFDTTPPTYSDPQPDFGVILLLKDGHYKTLGVADRIDDEELGLGDAAIRGLLDDFAARLIVAFGSAEKVGELLAQQPRHPWIFKVVAEGLTRAGIRVPPEMVMHGPALPWLDKPVSK